MKEKIQERIKDLTNYIKITVDNIEKENLKKNMWMIERENLQDLLKDIEELEKTILEN